MNRFYILICILVLTSCEQHKGSDTNDKLRVNKVCDDFMLLFKNENYSKALEILKENSVLAKETIDSLLPTISKQMENFIPAYGKAIGWEFISEGKIKDVLSKRLYILKFKKYYLKFFFIFTITVKTGPLLTSNMMMI